MGVAVAAAALGVVLLLPPLANVGNKMSEVALVICVNDEEEDSGVDDAADAEGADEEGRVEEAVSVREEELLERLDAEEVSVDDAIEEGDAEVEEGMELDAEDGVALLSELARAARPTAGCIESDVSAQGVGDKNLGATYRVEGEDRVVVLQEGGANDEEVARSSRVVIHGAIALCAFTVGGSVRKGVGWDVVPDTIEREGDDRV